MALSKDELIEALSNLTILDVTELVSALEEKWGVSAAAVAAPMMMAAGRNAAPETDLQIGYVTSFLNGRLALQTNAAYQTNAQGQRGATAVSLLSRAKIKF